MEADRSELYDRAEGHPEVVGELEGLFREWAARCAVEDWDDVLAKRKQKRES
jgi:hypothetical protein